MYKEILFSLIFMGLFGLSGIGQNDTTMNAKLPYEQIPDHPDRYTAANAIARMLDGLGYRYYWATESLRKEDLEYRVSDDSRTSLETLDHIHGLSKVILNTVSQIPNIRAEEPEYTYEELRKKTLENIMIASDILKNSTDKDLESYNVVFQRSDQSTSYPFWNLINGMAADALWHTGQIVNMRRASGNPLHPGVSVFRGKTRSLD